MSCVVIEERAEHWREPAGRILRRAIRSIRSARHLSVLSSRISVAPGMAAVVCAEARSARQKGACTGTFRVPLAVV